MNMTNETLTPKDFDDAKIESAKFDADVPSNLFDPKTKMSSKLRRAYRHSLGKLVTVETHEAKPEGIKTARKLASLPLAKVIRRLHQTARRAATARHILDKLAQGSRFRPPLEKEHNKQLSIFRQVLAELKHRDNLPMQ